MKIEIDRGSGFCFGVVKAIELAEKELQRGQNLYCLGDIVHNRAETERLQSLGIKIIDFEEFKKLRDCKVLFRAHGEPPETYSIARQNNIEVIDATCPVVLNLQKKIKCGYEDISARNGQVVIFGKKGHAEIIGLAGQTGEEAIVVEHPSDLDKIDFNRPVYFFSQTTRSEKAYKQYQAEIRKRMIQTRGNDQIQFTAYDTICGQVSNRETGLKEFVRNHDIILFISGKESSNGKMLYQVCKTENPYTYFVSDEEDIDTKWLDGIVSVGICGATSTPYWLMQKIADFISTSGKD